MTTPRDISDEAEVEFEAELPPPPPAGGLLQSPSKLGVDDRFVVRATLIIWCHAFGFIKLTNLTFEALFILGDSSY